MPPPILAQERALTYRHFIKMLNFENSFIGGYSKNVDITALLKFHQKYNVVISTFSACSFLKNRNLNTTATRVQHSLHQNYRKKYPLNAPYFYQYVCYLQNKRLHQNQQFSDMFVLPQTPIFSYKCLYISILYSKITLKKILISAFVIFQDTIL